MCDHNPACESRPCIKRCGTAIYRCGLYRRSWICRPCHYARVADKRVPSAQAEYLKRWRAANPERVAAQAKRRRLAQHGLTPAQYAELWAQQGGGCGCCKRTDSLRWCIDHDHAHCPGQWGCAECVRGILCLECNTGLAMFRDDQALLDRAGEYLARHRLLA